MKNRRNRDTGILWDKKAIDSSQKTDQDLAIIAVFVSLGLLLSFGFDVFERLAQWSRSYEAWQLDELFTLLMMLPLALSIFSWRRCQELKREITKRQEIEQSFYLAEQKYYSIFKNAVEGIYQTTVEGHYLEVNSALAQMYGYDSPAKLIAQLTNIEQQLYVKPTRRTEFMHLVQQQGWVSGFESQVYRKDGSIIWISEYARSIHAINGQLLGYEGIVENITERKQWETNLRVSEKRLQRQNQLFLELSKSSVSTQDSLNTIFRKITESAAQILKVARTSIWLYNSDRSKICCVDLYEQSTNCHQEGTELTAIDYPLYFQALASERIIAVSNAHTDPRTSEFSSSYLTPYHIQAMLDVPIWLDGQMVGVICHEQTGSVRQWSLEEQNFAGSVSDFISLAMESYERKQAENALRKAHEESEIRVQERTTELFQSNTLLKKEIAERQQAESALQNKSQALENFSHNLKHLHRINTTNYENFEALFIDCLETGRAILGLSTGIISQIVDQTCIIHEVQSELESFKAGLELALKDTYCAAVVKENRTVSYTQVGKIESMQTHPTYQKLKLEAYIGTPIFVNGKIYGILSFSSPEPRSDDFAPHEREILELMAQSLGRLIAADQAKAALKESKARFRLLIEGVKDYAIFFLDPQGYVRSWNTGAQRIKGYQASEIIGQHFACFYSEQDIQQGLPEQVLQETKKTGRFESEGWQIRQDGSCFWAHVVVTSLYNEAGQFQGFAKVTRDISDKRKAEEALRQSEARYRAIVETQTELIRKWLPDGTLSFVNEAYCRYWNQERSELLKHNFFLAIPAQDSQAIEKLLATLNPKSPTATSEHRVIMPTGEIRWQQWSNRAIFDAQGILVEIQSVGQDITERKQAEAELQRQYWRSQLFADITLKIRQSLQLEDILQTTVREVQKLLRADRVLILRLESQEMVKIVQEAVDPSWTSVLSEGIVDDCLGLDYLQKYPQGRIYNVADVENDNLDDCLTEFLRQFQVKSKLSLPILLGEQLWGMLIVHQCSHHREWSSFEIDLLQQLADQVGIAVSQSRLMESLRESEARFRLMANSAPVLLWLCSSNQNYTFFNKSWLDFTGRTLEQELGQGWINNIHPEDRQHFLETYQIAFESRQEFRLEYRLRRADGQYRWLINTGVPRLTPSGNFAGYIGSCIDISDRKQHEETLRMQASQQAVVAALGQDALKAPDLDTLINQALMALTCTLDMEFGSMFEHLPEQEALRLRAGVGWSPGLVGQVIVDATTDSQAGYTLLNAKPVIVKDFQTEQRFRPDCWLSNHQVVSSMSTVIYDKSGSFGVLAIYTNQARSFSPDEVNFLQAVANVLSAAIEQKQTEIALQDSEQRYATLAQTVPVGIFRTDAQRNCLYVNEHCGKMTGLTLAQTVGKDWIQILHPEDRDRVATNWSRAVQANLPFDAEYRLVRRDGSITWVYAQTVPERATDGSVVGFIGTLTDMTERLKMEEIRRELEREKELSDFKLRFFSMASHEFRTPLSVILFAAQILENSEPEWLDERKLRNIHRVQDAAKNMTQMLTDVLTIARAEAQRLEFSPKSLKLRKFCCRILEEIQQGLNFTAPIRFIYAGEGENDEVWVDEKLLYSILSNLLTNAIKYSPQGSKVDFQVILHAELIEFIIKDRGIGIPVEDQEHLFEAFHRGENVGKIDGTGLGLAVVKKSVDLHQGELRFESTVDEGTTFIVRIPKDLREN